MMYLLRPLWTLHRAAVLKKAGVGMRWIPIIARRLGGSDLIAV
jgi:hypothetical protein